MPLKFTFKAAIAAAALLIAATAAAQPAAAAKRPPNVIELYKQANQAYQDQDWAAYREAALTLHRMRPYNDDYMSMVVVAGALTEDRQLAYEMMLRMQQQGLAQDFNATDDSSYIRGTQVYDYVNDLLVRASEPAGKAAPVMTLPDDLMLPTSIAWDPGRKLWLVGNARDGAVYAVNADGQSEELIAADGENGLQGIYGLLVDAEHNRLWISSSPARVLKGFDPEATGPAAIFEYTLDDLEQVKQYPVAPDNKPHRLGALVRAPSGDIYTVDAILPIIYRLAPGADQLTPFAASPGMVSLRGLTLSDDGNMLYVADHAMGILALDIAGKESFKLSAPPNLNLGGIEGLFYWDGHLTMIQNGISPQRVMRLALSDDGRSIEEVAPLAVALPIFDKPDFGAVRGDDLVFFANSHWVRDPQAQGPVRVARVDMSEAPNLVAPDLEKFWDEYRAEQGVQPPSASQADEE